MSSSACRSINETKQRTQKTSEDDCRSCFALHAVNARILRYFIQRRICGNETVFCLFFFLSSLNYFAAKRTALAYRGWCRAWIWCRCCCCRWDYCCCGSSCCCCSGDAPGERYFETSKSTADWFGGCKCPRCLLVLFRKRKEKQIIGWTSLGCSSRLPAWMCFFWRALEFWNHTWVTRLLSPVTDAIRSRSWPSGLLSIWKLACSTCSCSSVNVVRTRFALLLWYPSVSHPSSFDNEANIYWPILRRVKMGGTKFSFYDLPSLEVVPPSIVSR